MCCDESLCGLWLMDEVRSNCNKFFSSFCLCCTIVAGAFERAYSLRRYGLRHFCSRSLLMNSSHVL